MSLQKHWYHQHVSPPALYTDTIVIIPRDTAGLAIDKVVITKLYIGLHWATNNWQGRTKGRSILNCLRNVGKKVLVFLYPTNKKEGKTGSHLKICCPMGWCWVTTASRHIISLDQREGDSSATEYHCLQPLYSLHTTITNYIILQTKSRPDNENNQIGVSWG